MNDEKLFYKELKAKRESQNLTLEEISDFTKIDIKFLIAIETGDFSSFSESFGKTNDLVSVLVPRVWNS